MISVFFYYVFYASVILVYGIGMERTVFLSAEKKRLGLKAFKMLITTVSASALSYLFVTSLLVPAELSELYPLVVLLFFVPLSVFVEAIIRITTKSSAVEFSVSLLFVFLSVSESTSLSECVFISFVSVLSFFGFIPLMYSLCRKVDLYEGKTANSRNAFVLSSIAIIMLILLCWNVSWLNKGVFQW
ncbi:hypothetical protein [Treponema sp.]|uniref:hypothetical protein n=1 Tax=Treponema sp. TaxID=166 RepID=UPI003F02342F